MTVVQTRLPMAGVDTEYDTISMHLQVTDLLTPISFVRLKGVHVANLHLRDWGAAQREADRRVEAGEVIVEYRTSVGTFTSDAVPPHLQNFVNERDPFRRRKEIPDPVLTTEQSRRAAVEAWARDNTHMGAMAEAMVSPKIAPAPDALTSRRRHVGQIWWAYVTNIVAAAQRDEWLTDTNVWPAIERALEITASDFIDRVSANNWNSPAAYMEAYSRIYQADATHLSVAPTWIQGEDLIEPVYPRLIAGADRAREIVFRQD